MGMGVVHRRRAVRGPAGVRDAGAAADLLGLHLLHQLGHPGRAARPLQAAGMDRHAAGVIAPVLEPLQALNQNRNDVAPGDARHDAAHENSPSTGEWADATQGTTKLMVKINR